MNPNTNASRRMSLAILPCTLVALFARDSAVQAFTAPQPKAYSPITTSLASDSNNLFFASAVTDDSSTTTTTTIDTNTKDAEAQTNGSARILGSQELLMLPRQYQPNLDKGEAYFPSMSHVMVTTLSATPSIEALSQAIDIAMDTHPLLRAHVQGNGEPSERIDLFQMVRKGEPNPCTFVAPEVKTFTSKDVLRVVDVQDGNDALEESWKTNFNKDIDDGSWYENASNGPLWRLTLHRLEGKKDGPCALVFSSNHAISDQGKIDVALD